MLKTLREKDLLAPSRKELLWSILCWVMFAVGFPLILPRLFDTDTPDGACWFQITYFACCFLLTGGIFFRFLKESFRRLRGNAKNILFAVAGGFAAYFVLTFVFTIAASGLLMLAEDGSAVAELTPEGEAGSSGLLIPMAICAVLLEPATVEILFRGGIFAPICRKRPWLAYVVSILLYAGLNALSFATSPSGPADVNILAYLAIFLQYIPEGLVLGWVYQRTRNILGPIFLHMLIYFVALFG